MVKHTVKCKKFPDPFDERDPVGPCTCGAEERTSKQKALETPQGESRSIRTTREPTPEAERRTGESPAPLPSNHVLWSASECMTNPHEAAMELQSRRVEIERLTANLSKLQTEAHEHYQPQIDKLIAEVNRLRAALERIEKWFGEFPASGRNWENGDEMTYGAAFGSNGERDYMRGIAREALAGAPDETTAWRCPKCEGTKFHYAEECPAANGEGGL